MNSIQNFGHGRRNNLVKIADKMTRMRSHSVVITDDDVKKRIRERAESEITSRVREQIKKRKSSDKEKLTQDTQSKEVEAGPKELLQKFD